MASSGRQGNPAFSDAGPPARSPTLTRRVLIQGTLRRTPARDYSDMPSRKAATLLELIIVILIIMILISMFLPVLGKARRRAARIYCENNFSRISGAVGMYARDYERPPPRSWLPSVDRNSVFLPDVLHRYVGGQDKIFICPGDSVGLSDRPPPNGGRSFIDSERSSYSFRLETGVAEYEKFHDSQP